MSDVLGLFQQAIAAQAGQPPAPPQAPAESVAAPATPEGDTPPAQPPATEPPEPAEPDMSSALAALGISQEKMAEATKLFNDAKSKKGRETAAENRTLKDQLAKLQQKAQQADILQQQFSQLQPLMDALKPRAEAPPDPIKSNPVYQRLSTKYQPDELADIAALAKAVIEPELVAIKQQRAQDEAALERDAYIASIMEPSDGNPIGWKDIEPLIAGTLEAHPEINEAGETLFQSGASPKALIDYLRGQVVAHNLDKLASKFSQKPADIAPPPPPSPGKSDAAPLKSGAPPPPNPNPKQDEVGLAFLSAVTGRRPH